MDIPHTQSQDHTAIPVTGQNIGVASAANNHAIGGDALFFHSLDRHPYEIAVQRNIQGGVGKLVADVVGSYPEKENEIMVSRGVLERMGIDTPSMGMEIPLAYYTDSEKKDLLMEETFCLSGWFTSYAFVQSTDTADVIFVSRALSEKYGKTVEKDGSASVKFIDEAHIPEYCDALVSDLGLSENQPVATVQFYDTSEGQEIATLLSLCAVAVFLIFTGYLLIYNILYISISRDVRF